MRGRLSTRRAAITVGLIDRVGLANALSTTSSPPERSKTSSPPERRKWLDTPVVERPTEFDRYAQIPVAFTNHLCLGSIYAWSVFNQPLMSIDGVVAPSSIDWSLGDINTTFSLVMGGFAWGAVFSTKLDAWGPRRACMYGAGALGAGFGLAALGVHQHSLPLLYAGGLVWGVSNGFYVAPISTLISFFPDRKGFAAGSVVVGFGGAALFAAPAFSGLLATFRKPPEFLGRLSEVSLSHNVAGHQIDADSGKEVVVAGVSELERRMPNLVDLAAHHDPGVFVAGSGSTGVAETFAVLGCTYACVNVCTALMFRVPGKSYVDDFAKNNAQATITTHNVSLKNATRSPQFVNLYAGFVLAATGAYAVISTSQLLLNEGMKLNEYVTPETATMLIAGMSFANLSGRLFWSNLGDYLGKKKNDPFLGRRLSYGLMWASGPLGYAGVLWALSNSGNGMPALSVLCGSLFLINANFGGAAAGRAAIIGDLFGTKNLGAITSRQLSAVLPGAFLGPQLMAWSRDRHETKSVAELTELVTDSDFFKAFDSTKEHLRELTASHTVTVQRLLDICPDGTPDPSAHAFDEALLGCAGLTLAALATNAALKPVCETKHE